MYASDEQKTPGRKLLLAILVGVALAIPIFMVWALVYDRQTRSDEARASITEGWGGPQVMSGPVLVIPYQATITETSDSGGKQVTRTRTIDKELALDPEAVDIVIPGNDDALKSVRLVVEQLASAVEEGSAQHRDHMAAVGAAEKREENAPTGDEPRPTRGNRMPRRPLAPELVSADEANGESPAPVPVPSPRPDRLAGPRDLPDEDGDV